MVLGRKVLWAFGVLWREMEGMVELFRQRCEEDWRGLTNAIAYLC